MKIKQQVLSIHQLDVEDVAALDRVDKILTHLQETYGSEIVLASPNTGEIVQIDELARVKGILSFICCNRVVEPTLE